MTVTQRRLGHDVTMGFLDRLIGAVNKVDEVVDDIEYRIFMDRRFAQADRLAAEGVRNEGVVTGIKRRFEDGGTNTLLRLSWFAPEERSCGILLGTGRVEAIRLGGRYAIRTDAGEAVLDWAAMWAGGSAPGQRRTRFVPDAGIDDTAFDSRVLGRWKKWAPQRARVESFALRTALGMPIENVDIVLQCADGVRRTNPNEVVPFYGAWFVGPGSDVPVVVDPKGGDRTQIDWRRLAIERAVEGGRWQDAPPAGTLAEARLNFVPPQTQAMATGPLESIAPAPGGLEPIEGVGVEKWAEVTAALMTARVPPAQYDAYAADTHGVPPGRWTEIDREWTARQMADWKVGAAMGEAVEAARKAQKKRR